MWMLGWGSDNGDPDNYIGYHFAHDVGEPKVEDCYANDKLAQLLIDGRKEPDLAKREKIYQEAEQLVRRRRGPHPGRMAADSDCLPHRSQGLRAGRVPLVV